LLPRLRPLINAGLRKLGHELDPRKIADVTVLAPEEIQPVPRPFFLDDQPEKATRVIPGVESLRKEIQVALDAEAVHAPLIRYTLKDCLVHEAGFDALRGSARKKPMPGLRFLAEPTGAVPRATYCMSDPGHLYFAHWLIDSCSTALLAPPGEALLLDMRKDWPHTTAYASAFGLEPAPGRQYAVDYLTFYQDHALGSSRRARWAEMRRRLQVAVPDALQNKADIYFRRGRAGTPRVVANEDEVMEALQRRGFEVFDIDGATMESIQRRFRSARMVVGMEGSHLCHLHLCMQAGSAILAMIPADRFTMVQLGYANAADLRFGFVVVDPTPQGYRVNVADLLRTIDLFP
jgi:hypothetical protein